MNYFVKPIFQLNKLLEYPEDFVKTLEEITSIKMSEPIIKPFNPTKVLSKNHETLEFDYVFFKEREFKLLEKIKMGFGENGYYYDMVLKFGNNNDDYNFQDIEPILTEINNVSGKIESELTDYYFLEPSTVKKLEISNIVFYVEFERSIDSLLNPKISSEFAKIGKSSEDIIPDVGNKAHFDFVLRIYPEIIEEGPLVLAEDIIVPERLITISKDMSRPKKNQYRFRTRGIPVVDSIRFLNQIRSLIDINQ